MDVARTAQLQHLLAEVHQIKRSQSDIAIKSDLSDLSSKLSSIFQTGAELRAEQTILASLTFRHIRLRHSKIPESHRNTFNWMFERELELDPSRPNVQFLHWLEQGQGIYWIAGKAGSGKSCLMKFLCDHSVTHSALLRWAATDYKGLVKASFFFWSSGIEQQRSQEGLLRTLLFEILRQYPHLISHAVPKDWEILEVADPMEHLWTRSELLAAFRRVCGELNSTMKFCFFIDGLDEYCGDPQDIINLLDWLVVSSDHIKLCVSSRPWPIFRHHFDLNPCCRLYLQDLTRKDIKEFVHDELESNPMFIEARKKNSELDEIAEEVVIRAQGVFLWVSLVLRSLLTGLTNKDHPQTLLRRLYRLPADLEEYFQHMLSSVDEVYQSQMVRSFHVAAASDKPMPILLYSVVDDIEHDDHLGLPPGGWKVSEETTTGQSMDVCPKPPELIQQIENDMRDRLDARSRGLLEVCHAPSNGTYLTARVDFLHRTVREFLVSRIESYETFNAKETVCHSLLVMIKTLPLEISKEDDASVLDQLIDDFLHYCLEADSQSNERLIQMIDELDGFLMRAYTGSEQRLDDRLLNGATARSLFELCVQRGLNFYVAKKLEQKPSLLHSPWSRPLLAHALFPSNVRYLQVNKIPMVQTLIKFGASPSAKFETTTIWRHFLEVLDGNPYFYLPQADKEAFPLTDDARIMGLLIGTLLDAGADPDEQSFFDDLVNKSEGGAINFFRYPLEERNMLLAKCLSHGANPNAKSGSMTVWKRRLASIHAKARLTSMPAIVYHRLFIEVKTLLSHGADINIEIPSGKSRPNKDINKSDEHRYDISAREALLTIFEPDEYEELMEIWRQRNPEYNLMRRFQNWLGPWR